MKYFAKVKYKNTKLFDKTMNRFKEADVCYLGSVYFLSRLIYHKLTHRVALYWLIIVCLTFVEISLVYYLRDCVKGKEKWCEYWF